MAAVTLCLSLALATAGAMQGSPSIADPATIAAIEATCFD